MEPDSSQSLFGKNASFVKFLQHIHKYAERCISCDNSDVKTHIASFSVIYNNCTDKDELKKFICRSSGLITRLYSKLSEYFYKYEPFYIQEFYSHWKEVLLCMQPKSLAKCCQRYLPQMNTTINHLRSAPDRLEQLAIVNVLFLYAENVDVKEIKSDLESDRITINRLAEISQAANTKSFKAVQRFLNYLNLEGSNIFTIKAIRATAVNLHLRSLEQEQEVWVDLNLKDKSIAFIVYASETEQLLCSGIASAPEIQHYLFNGEYYLLCSGWTLFDGNDIVKLDEVSKIMFTCQAADKIKIESFESRFNVSEYLDYDNAAGRQ